MARLVLLNGVPGADKERLAPVVARRLEALLIDVDADQEVLVAAGRSHAEAKRAARASASEAVRAALAERQNVVVAAFVVRPDFADELAAHAGDLGAVFSEVVLLLDADQLTARLGTGPERADVLTSALRAVLLTRPRAGRVSASGDSEHTAERVLDQLAAAEADN